MTRRPIHRWKSLWLGVFVLGSLAWAWWDSSRHVSLVGSDRFSVWRLDGNTVVCWRLDRPSGRWGTYRNAPTFQKKDFQLILESDVNKGIRWFMIPDSLVVSTFAGLWAAWLAWHWRRQRIPTEANAP